MKLKKLSAICLATAMTVTAMNGCGSKENAETKAAGTTAAAVKEEAAATTAAPAATEAPAEEKGITFPLAEKMTFTGYANYMSTEAGKGDLNDSEAWKIVKERANIEIELTSVLADERAEKLGLLFASGDYPDMLIKCNLSGEEYGVKEGILIPLEDLIREYAPNLEAFLDENNYWPYITSSDGHVYTLPYEMTVQNPFQKYWINTKWMETLGLEEPTSYEELYEVLKAFKEQDPNGNGEADEIPITACTATLPHLLLTYADYPIHINKWLGVKDGELVYVPMQEDYKEFLAYLAKLYGEGLLDPESFTQNISQQSAKGKSAEIFGSFFRANPSATVGTEFYQNFRILTPFHEGTYARNNPVEAGTFAITDACENPEVLMAWVDYFYTEEGATLAYMGVEGLSYKWNDNGLWSKIEVEGDSNEYNSLHGQTYYPAIVPEIYTTKRDFSEDPINELIISEQNRVDEVGKSVCPLPPMLQTEEETELISTINADVKGYVNEYLAKVTVGEYDLEATWDEYIETLKAMRVDELFAAYKAAYDRAME